MSAARPFLAASRFARPNLRQAALAALALVLGLALYLGLERGVTPRVDLSMPLDARIPFLPWTWAVYIAYFPFVVLAAAYADEARFRRFAWQAGAAFALAMLCFMLWPEILTRPPVAEIDNAFLRQRIARLWWLDAPANGFPSLHVALTCLACGLPAAPVLRRAAVPVALLIVASTLTLKQHTLADVAGGLALAGLMVAAAFWRRDARRAVRSAGAAA